ncbi:MAG: biotin/lipoate A/B protein ligase family protein [Candidatus Bathyarchaeia archaeon]
METWRLIPFETHDAYMNMAIDEAILTARIAEQVPNTLRLYRWQPSAVSIGKNQKPQNELYIENCRRRGIDIVRRISGGGTVFHSATGEVTYSVTAKVASVGKDIATIYKRVYAAIADALRLLGIPADYNSGDEKNCPNLMVNGKKISGSAQVIRKGVVLQHGTLLLDANLEEMFTLLRVPWTDDYMQAACVARRKITSIHEILRHLIAPETVCNALTAGFKNIFHINFVSSGLTPYEQELAVQLCKEKYAVDKWNFEGKVVNLLPLRFSTAHLGRYPRLLCPFLLAVA